MELSLVNAGLAAGAALAVLPVLLHLFMRQKPKKVVFPALRLIKERHKRSTKKLRVKNWLLLLARMALLALMALALARPTIQSEASLGDRDVPSAIALVFDTSLSMGYTERDKTRLAEAKERAAEILSRTPATSQVFVIDSATPGVPAGLTPQAARKPIEALDLRAVNRPLNAAVGQAFAAVSGSDKPRHEVYVLTDLARSAWDAERAVDGLDKATKAKPLPKPVVLRLSPQEVKDVAVVDARPVSPVVTEGDPVEIKARIRGMGAATTRVAELTLDGRLREKKTVEVPADGEVDVRFTIPKVDPGKVPHQGEVRITGAPDPLAFDDVRYFTFNVQPATRVLVVSDLPIDSEFIADAIDPDPATLPPGTPRPFRVDQVRTSQFLDRSRNLTKTYQVVFLNNVAELSEAEWGKLGGYVVDGGGLVIGLGDRVKPENYQTPTAGQVLPVALDKKVTPKEPTEFGQVADYTHPLFQRYPKQLDAMLTATPVFRYWATTPREGASRTLLSFADKAPALVERVFKGSRTGRVLLWTTPLSRRFNSNSADAWNEFPTVGWSFFLLMNQSVAYLTGTSEEGWNFDAGRDVVLPIDVTRRYKSFVVQDREKKTSDRLTLPANSDALVVASPQHLGHWVVNASGDGGVSETLAFSVNAPAGETQFVPLETDDLDKLFGGKDRYALADNTEESLREVVQKVRFGRELFPWLMFAILIVVCLESLLANRFYRESAPPKAVPSTRQAAA